MIMEIDMVDRKDGTAKEEAARSIRLCLLQLEDEALTHGMEIAARVIRTAAAVCANQR